MMVELRFGIVLAVTTTFLTWAAQLEPMTRVIERDTGMLPCPGPPQYSIGYQREWNGIVQDGPEYIFNGVAWLDLSICQPGLLKLTVSGQQADGKAPNLKVSFNSKIVLDQYFNSGESKTQLYLPEAGLVRLAYFNDYYKSEARVAWLEEVRLINSPCGELEAVSLPVSTPENWEKGVFLSSAARLVIKPCHAGQLEFKLIGKAALREDARVKFEQEGSGPLILNATPMRRLIRLSVTDKPITLSLLNPYFKELADRNLYLHSITFTPDAPTTP